jgi:hypothetical protein
MRDARECSRRVGRKKERRWRLSEMDSTKVRREAVSKEVGDKLVDCIFLIIVELVLVIKRSHPEHVLHTIRP